MSVCLDGGLVCAIAPCCCTVHHVATKHYARYVGPTHRFPLHGLLSPTTEGLDFCLCALGCHPFLVNVVDRNGTQMNLGADHCVGKRSYGLPAIAVSCGSFTFCGGMAADFGNQQKEVLPGPQSFVTGQIWPSRKSCLFA